MFSERRLQLVLVVGGEYVGGKESMVQVARPTVENDANTTHRMVHRWGSTKIKRAPLRVSFAKTKRPPPIPNVPLP